MSASGDVIAADPQVGHIVYATDTVDAPVRPANTLVLNTGDIKRAARGRWCLIRTRNLDVQRGVPFIDFLDRDGERVSSRCLLGRAPRITGGGYWAVAHVAWSVAAYELGVLGRHGDSRDPALQVTPISAGLSALFLLLGRPSALGRLLRRRHHLRPALAELAITYNHPGDYAFWNLCFEQNRPAPSRGASGMPRVAALIFDGAGTSPAMRTATLRSLDANGARHVASDGRDVAAWVAQVDADYIAVLEAGEVLAPHATDLMCSEIVRLRWPSTAIADVDAIDARGNRRDPQFRPEPNHTLMLSGTLTGGVWVIRRDILAAWLRANPAVRWAQALRLDVWLRQYAAGDHASRRIPHILSHIHPETRQPTAGVLTAIVDAHLARVRMPFRAEPARPIRLVLHAQTPVRPVDIVIPSTLKAPRSLDCIRAVLAGTGHADIRVLVVVTQPDPLDATQTHAAAQICRDPRARVIRFDRASFNYSEANNFGAAQTRPGDLCLLNDDVSPLGPDWLDRMCGHLNDDRVGIVGARLLYPDHTIQHAGVIMGMGGLCDHANRHLPGDDDGYLGRAGLAQEFSAVTGACMLIRQGVFELVGGLDEAYPSAFNDVDFCLRVRERGHAVVYEPGATLTHFEMQTYGSHYAGARAPFERVEVARMQRRWADVIAADPFHSPNLDLLPGREWACAFPPRRPPEIAWPGVPRP